MITMKPGDASGFVVAFLADDNLLARRIGLGNEIDLCGTLFWFA